MNKPRPTKYMSDKQEKRVAKQISARPVIASGSLWGSKGDVRHDDYLVECKTTAKSFFPLSLITWEKIEREAIKDGLRIPVMCIDLEDGKYSFAVFRLNTIEIEQPELEINQIGKSFRIKTTDYEIPFISIFKGSQNKPLKLCIVPWELFVETVNP